MWLRVNSLLDKQMDLDQYVAVISESAAETGYDGFLPSMCVVGEDYELNVLQTELSPNGEETLAKDWASKFTSDDSLIYLAYRSGDRIITIVEISGTNVTQKCALKIKPISG